MRNIHPDHTKVRIYLETDSPQSIQHKTLFLKRVREFRIDAATEFCPQNGQSIIEVISRRDTIHEHVVPLIEEMLQNAFVTMEAVCAFRTPEVLAHPVYGKNLPILIT